MPAEIKPALWPLQLEKEQRVSSNIFTTESSRVRHKRIWIKGIGARRTRTEVLPTAISARMDECIGNKHSERGCTYLYNRWPRITSALSPSMKLSLNENWVPTCMTSLRTHYHICAQTYCARLLHKSRFNNCRQEFRYLPSRASISSQILTYTFALFFWACFLDVWSTFHAKNFLAPFLTHILLA